MEVILVRHGIAIDRATPGLKSDESRELTPEGIEKTRVVAQGLKKIGCVPGRIVSSPLIRAKETAEIVTSVIAPQHEIEIKKYLAPGKPLSNVISWLEKQKSDDIMLVGHMPDLAELASLLISNTPTLDIRFKKAAVCCISFYNKCKSGTGCFEWLLQPKHLRLLGK